MPRFCSGTASLLTARVFTWRSLNMYGCASSRQPASGLDSSWAHSNWLKLLRLLAQLPSALLLLLLLVSAGAAVLLATRRALQTRRIQRTNKEC